MSEAISPQRLAEIRQKNAASVAYLATELDAEALADTAYGYGAELLAGVDRLAARVAELEGENEHFRSQLNDDMARETKLVVESAEAAIAIDDLSAEVVRLARELAEARGMARYAYQRWPAPIFWHAAARHDSPYTALPDWLTEPQPAAAPDGDEGNEQ